MMLLVAAGFGTFMLFVALGLGALAVTAALDRVLGKEVALLGYALALLALTLVALRASADDPGRAAPQTDKVLAVVTGGHKLEADLTARPAFTSGEGERRNGFARFSDTRPLPPVDIDTPQGIELDFPLPPPIPGPAPAARRLLRGTVPALAEDDASTPVEVPPIQFSEFKPTPADVFDWFDLPTGGRNYVAIVSLNGVRPSEPGFGPLKRQLAAGEGLERLDVEWANVGGEAAALKVLDPASAARVSKANRSTQKASERGPVWHFRRTVQNEYEDQLAQNLPGETLEATQNVAGLLRAAERMEELGRQGKEGREGWRRAALLLERALAVAQSTLGPDRQADILVRLVVATKALNDEQSVLRALTAYAKAAPLSPQPAVWTGELVLTTLGLPEEAQVWFRKARTIDATNEAAALGEGDALSAQGRHKEALAAYEKGGTGFEAQVRRAEAALRLGDLARAQAASDAALSLSPEAPRALLARGALLYVKGDLAGARGAFAMAAVSTAENGLWRAQALYDLGLTCWRLKETRAAVAAFDACDQALRMGSQPSRFSDETVSPSLGRALVAFSLKPRETAAEGAEAPADPAAPAPALTVRREGLGEYLAAARDEARRSSYREHLAGVLASQQGNVEAAIRSLRRSLALAPEATELDGWLALNHLRWAFTRAGRPTGPSPGGASGRDTDEQALESLMAQPAADHFEAAVAFAARASQNDLVDPAAYHAQLRETWVRLQAEHLSPRKRFEAAVAAADRVLNRSDLREQPAARAMRAYARYRLGGDPTDPGADNNYNKCQNDLDQVLDKVADKEGTPWYEWRVYAARTLEKIKHWRSLEEKIVSLEGLTTLTKDWQSVAKGSGIDVDVEDGLLVIRGTAAKDGTSNEPLVALLNWTFFEKSTFESLSIRLKVPTTDASGNAINNIVFGVGVQGQTAVSGAAPGGLPARHPGLSIFYDKAKVAGRVGTGLAPAWKDGEVKRVRDEAGAERPWPASEWIELRFVRQDAKEGSLAVYLGDDEVAVLSDKVSGFRGVSGKAELWIGGWAQMAQRFEVYVKDIRVVRSRK